MNLLLLLGVWIMALCFLIGGSTKLRLSEADYEEVQVNYNQVYLTKYDRTESMIVIEHANGVHYIYPQLLRNYLDMTQVLKALEKSPKVTLWCENTGHVGGAMTDQITIPLSHGIEVEHHDDRGAIGFSIFWFIAGIAFYLYMKWYYGKDWMFAEPPPQVSNDELTTLNLAGKDSVNTEPPKQNSNDDFTTLNLK